MPWKIPKDDYGEGIRLCRKNAKFLIRNADKAFKQGVFHGAYLLAIAALEEVGKAVVIMNHWEEDKITFEVYMNEICNHKLKVTLALTLIDENMIEKYARTPREYGEIVLDEEHRDLLVNTRTRSVYLDYYFPQKGWRKPLERMDELASTAIRRTKEALSYFGPELRHRGISI